MNNIEEKKVLEIETNLIKTSFSFSLVLVVRTQPQHIILFQHLMY